MPNTFGEDLSISSIAAGYPNIIKLIDLNVASFSFTMYEYSSYLTDLSVSVRNYGTVFATIFWHAFGL